MRENNLVYSRISLNHLQQKTDLLTIGLAVIRKRRPWTANMAVAWTASSGENICCCPPPPLFFPLLTLKGVSEAVGNSFHILNAILGRKYRNHRNRIISSVHDRLFCRHQHLGSVHGYSETWSRSNVWKEYTHTEGHKYDKSHFLDFRLKKKKKKKREDNQ